MTGYLTVSTPATVHPVSLAEAKAHLRVRGSLEDSYIEGLIAAAFSMVEMHTGRALATQTWEYKVAQPSTIVRLPLAPVASIAAMTYFDQNDASQSLTVSDFYLFADRDKATVEPKATVSWPAMYDRPDALTIQFVAGYGSAAAVPPVLKQAGLFLVAHWFENRELMSDGKGAELPMGYHAMIAPYRTGFFA